MVNRIRIDISRVEVGGFTFETMTILEFIFF